MISQNSASAKFAELDWQPHPSNTLVIASAPLLTIAARATSPAMLVAMLAVCRCPHCTGGRITSAYDPDRGMQVEANDLCDRCDGTGILFPSTDETF